MVGIGLFREHLNLVLILDVRLGVWVKDQAEANLIVYDIGNCVHGIDQSFPGTFIEVGCCRKFA